MLGDETEWAFTLCALGAAAGALLLGWRKHHSLRVVWMLGAGIALLLLARLFEDRVDESAGTALSVLAGVTLVAGHLSNIGAALALGVRLRSAGQPRRHALMQLGCIDRDDVVALRHAVRWHRRVWP